MSAPYDKSALQINSRSHTYEIDIRESALDGLNPSDRLFIITDERFEEKLNVAGFKNVVTVIATEDNKTLQSVENIVIQLKNYGVRRQDQIVAVGGGIIQDLSTLTASLYMRGINWIYLPTTLLGMIDSCIGGKSSINVDGIKNLVGNIYPPKRILIGTEFCGTLSKADHNAGLAEAAKICFCKGDFEFQEFLRLSDRKDNTVIRDLIEFVLSTKKWFIEIDEFDKNERQLLNFGHTFGHALEVATNYEVAHGLAVALGMQAAIAFESKNRETSRIEGQLFNYLTTLIDEAKVLQTVSTLYDAKKFEDSFSKDKKHSSDLFRIILPNPHGGVRMEELMRTGESISAVTEAMKTVLERDSR